MKQDVREGLLSLYPITKEDNAASTYSRAVAEGSIPRTEALASCKQSCNGTGFLWVDILVVEILVESPFAIPYPCGEGVVRKPAVCIAEVSDVLSGGAGQILCTPLYLLGPCRL